MRCIIPNCDNVSTQSSQEITFHIFPTEPTLRTAWLEALNMVGWQPDECSAVCSKHFLDEDLLNSGRPCAVRTGAVPVADVLVCRICLASDRKLYSMTAYKILSKTFEMFMGLTNEDQLPFLCSECARRLLDFARFKNIGLQAHSILLDIAKSHGYITLQLIQASKGIQFSLTSDRSDYDLDVELTERENAYTEDEEAEMEHLPSLNVEVVIDGIKTESEDINNEDVNEKDPNKDSANWTNDAKAEHNGMKQNSTNSINANPELRDSFVGEDTSSVGSRPSAKTRLKAKLRTCAGRQGAKISKSSAEAADLCRNTEADSEVSPHKFSCDVCPYRTSSENQFSTHLKAHAATVSFSCSACSYITVSKRNLTYHARVHSGERPFSCKGCSKAFYTQSDLNRHGQVHSDRQLAAHMKTQSAPSSYSCDVCGKAFTLKCHLKRHLRAHSGNRPYSCEVCNKSFKQKSALKSHLWTHCDERPFACDLCNKSFMDRSHLNTHARIHSGERPYSCDICDKVFRYKNNLTVHLRIHSGDKPYLCDVCNRTFNQKSALKSHLWTHSDERPYSCDVCHKTFTDKSYLKTHSRIHTGVKPYLCVVCNRAFNRQYNLTKHLRTHSGVN